MKLLIFGPQGSGKGTQAKMLAKKFKLSHVSPGAIMRREIEKGTALGKQVEPLLDAGKLVSTEIIMKIMKKVLKENPDIIIDGFPRESHQATEFDKLVEVDKAILLEVPDKISIARIGGRRTCDKGHEYHITFMPSKQKDTCDIDNLPLHKRDDDEDKAIHQRLQIYHKKTEPVVRHYEKQGKLLRINGAQSIEDVFKEIIKQL